MLQLFQFAFMSNLQDNTCCNSEEYNTQILIVHFVGFGVIIQPLGRHFDDPKLLAEEILAVLHVWLKAVV